MLLLPLLPLPPPPPLLLLLLQVVSAMCVPGEWLCLPACSGKGVCEGDGTCTCDPKYALAHTYTHSLAHALAHTLAHRRVHTDAHRRTLSVIIVCGGRRYAGPHCDKCAGGRTLYPECLEETCFPDPCTVMLFACAFHSRELLPHAGVCSGAIAHD